MPVSLKLQHRVHHVLQHLRTCNCSVLVDVTNQKYRDVGLFGKLHQLTGTLFYLRDRPDRRLYSVRMQGLNGEWVGPMASANAAHMCCVCYKEAAASVFFGTT